MIEFDMSMLSKYEWIAIYERLTADSHLSEEGIAELKRLKK